MNAVYIFAVKVTLFVPSAELGLSRLNIFNHKFKVILQKFVWTKEKESPSYKCLILIAVYSNIVITLPNHVQFTIHKPSNNTFEGFFATGST